MLDRFTFRGKAVAAVIAVVVVLGIGVGIGSIGRTGSTSPSVAASAGASPAPTATPALAQGNSTSVTSSAGVDYGAGLDRLEGSPFAQTSDPAVFAASVQAGLGFDYRSVQPADIAAEADRINQEILAGMTGSDGPLGAQVHDAMRSAVTRSTDVDQLEYRVQARQHDEIDVTGVQVLDNEELHQDVGDEVYAAIIAARAQGIYQFSVTSAVTTTVQAVGDTAGWTQTRTSSLHVLVHCPAGGVCSLIGIVGSEAA